MGAIEGQEDPEVTAIREALGAVAVAEPAAYSLHTDAQGNWCVRRDGDAEARRFASREEALVFVRLAVVRCASYRLSLQGSDCRITRREFYRRCG